MTLLQPTRATACPTPTCMATTPHTYPPRGHLGGAPRPLQLWQPMGIHMLLPPRAGAWAPGEEPEVPGEGGEASAQLGHEPGPPGEEPGPPGEDEQPPGESSQSSCQQRPTGPTPTTCMQHRAMPCRRPQQNRSWRLASLGPLRNPHPPQKDPLQQAHPQGGQGPPASLRPLSPCTCPRA